MLVLCSRGGLVDDCQSPGARVSEWTCLKVLLEIESISRFGVDQGKAIRVMIANAVCVTGTSSVPPSVLKLLKVQLQRLRV